MTTFKCDVCGEERQKEFINILKKDKPFIKDIKFCNDKPSCFFGAEKIRLIGPKKVKESP